MTGIDQLQRREIEQLDSETIDQLRPTDTIEPGRRSRRRWTTYVRDLVLGLVVIGACLMAAGLHYTERFSIQSGSMEPTLAVGETVWSIRLMREPQRGDIVAFPNPADPTGTEILVKRVIGLPGEMIEATAGIVHIDLGRIDESVLYDSPELTADFNRIEIGQDELFVMGDNRDQSTDSRTFGPIPASSVQYLIIGQD